MANDNRDKQGAWKRRREDGSWWAWVGNNLWMVCTPETRMRYTKRSHHQYRAWRAQVVCGRHWLPIPLKAVVRASRTDDLPTLADAKALCEDDARAVSLAVFNILEGNFLRTTAVR